MQTREEQAIRARQRLGRPHTKERPSAIAATMKGGHTMEGVGHPGTECTAKEAYHMTEGVGHPETEQKAEDTIHEV